MRHPPLPGIELPWGEGGDLNSTQAPEYTEWGWFELSMWLFLFQQCFLFLLSVFRTKHPGTIVILGRVLTGQWKTSRDTPAGWVSTGVIKDPLPSDQVKRVICWTVQALSSAATSHGNKMNSINWIDDIFQFPQFLALIAKFMPFGRRKSLRFLDSLVAGQNLRGFLLMWHMWT